MRYLPWLLLLLIAAAIAAPPSADITTGTTAKFYSFPYHPPVRDTRGHSFDENGVNRSPLIILDKDGKPLTPESKVLNRGEDSGCGLILIDGSPYVVRCK